MDELTAEHRKLAVFVGLWIGDDIIHPAPWAPHGGTGTTTYTGRLALDGFVVIGDDVQVRPGLDNYLAHKVFGWDPLGRRYTFYLVDSTGQARGGARRVGGRHRDVRAADRAWARALPLHLRPRAPVHVPDGGLCRQRVLAAAHRWCLPPAGHAVSGP